MKGCMQWNSLYGRKDFASSGDRTRSARSVGQRLFYRATGAPKDGLNIKRNAYNVHVYAKVI